MELESFASRHHVSDRGAGKWMEAWCFGSSEYGAGVKILNLADYMVGTLQRRAQINYVIWMSFSKQGSQALPFTKRPCDPAPLSFVSYCPQPVGFVGLKVLHFCCFGQSLEKVTDCFAGQ